MAAYLGDGNGTWVPQKIGSTLSNTTTLSFETRTLDMEGVLFWYKLKLNLPSNSRCSS
jgi:hypothetical protein